MQLQNTPACKMRDALWVATFSNKVITRKEITDRLSKIEIPDWLQADILQMADHRKYERLTCPVEQAMEAAIHYKIVDELVKNQ